MYEQEHISMASTTVTRMRANLTSKLSAGSRSSSAGGDASGDDSNTRTSMHQERRRPTDSNADTVTASSSSSGPSDESIGVNTSIDTNNNSSNDGDDSYSTSTPIRPPSATAIPATPGQNTNPPLSVLFLSSDTGGGHRASAMSLGRQFELLYPGTAYQLLDVVTECMPVATSPGQSFGAGAAGSSGSLSASSSTLGGDRDDDNDNDYESNDNNGGQSRSEIINEGQEMVLGDEKCEAEEVAEISSQDKNAGGAQVDHDDGSGCSADNNFNAKDDADTDNDHDEVEDDDKLNLPTLTKTGSTTDDGTVQARNNLPPRPSGEQQQQPATTTASKKNKSAESSPPPAFGIESFYKHLSAHPHQWRLLYHTTNTPPVRLLTDVGLKLATERAVTAKIRKIEPDVVISVHPMMNSIPGRSCTKISSDSGKHLPFFTVVTDLGSGHDAWFAGKRDVERIFLASDSITDLAVRRGRIPRDKIVRSGLPIRHEFAVHSRGMGGDRSSDQGRRYRMTIRQDKLDLSNEPEHRVVLVMGGGEGCGALSSIVDSLYVELCSRSVDATIVVVCGRNKTLQETLETRDWEALRKRGHKRAERRRKTVVLAQRVRRMLSSISTGDLRGSAEAASTAVRSEDPNVGGNDGDDIGGNAECPGSTTGAIEEKIDALLEGEDALESPEAELYTSSAEARDENDSGSEGEKDDDAATPASPTGDCLSPSSSMESLAEGSASVQIMPQGFVTNMAEYMVGADLLLSKAGPGTIAEAASLGLPVMLTSYLPGQEEGNVDFVIKNGFGAYVADSDPDGVAKQCSSWLRAEDALAEQSRNAMEAGVPNAAEDIARHIGQSVVRWMQHNEAS